VEGEGRGHAVRAAAILLGRQTDGCVGQVGVVRLRAIHMAERKLLAAPEELAGRPTSRTRSVSKMRCTHGTEVVDHKIISCSQT